MLDFPFEENRSDYLQRPRISALLANVMKSPLTIVCAGAGYGKTSAVFDYARGILVPVIWLHFSEYDNAGSRFWTKYVQLSYKWNKAFAEQCLALGFPDTPDKLNNFAALHRHYAPRKKYLFVLDNAHLITHPDIIHFIEWRFEKSVSNNSIILICRDVPDINLAKLMIKTNVPSISEIDLSFTEDEIARFLSHQNIQISREDLNSIYHDTGGWAFAVNLVARSLKKAPGYTGYVQVAMKQNIFKLMEAEVFNVISERLQRFLIQLSLIDHLSADLVFTLAKNDAEFLSELKRAHAYIRFDDGINAYEIHHLFLDFLCTKQSVLSDEETTRTYRIAASWCCDNGFVTDALRYLHFINDFDEIASLLMSLPVQMPSDVAQYAAEILDSAPSNLFEETENLAIMHVRVIIRLGKWEEAIALMRRYEEQILKIDAKSEFRNRNLASIYYSWGNLRALMGVMDDKYDFDLYYEKMAKCLIKTSVELGQYADLPIGMWAILAGSTREGAPQKYIESAKRAADYISQSWGGSNKGVDRLCQAELFFYQGNMKAAEPIFIDLLSQDSKYKQYEIENKARFYLMRTALWQGNIKKAKSMLGEMEAGLANVDYAHRFFNYDAAFGWYHLALRQGEMVPAWLKEQFSPYSHAYYIENLGNQIKARYHYLNRDYPPLLAYIEGVKRRESIIYGYIEMLVFEACIYLAMKDKSKAIFALTKAYEAAIPNNILIPFVEMGKDMRTLTATVLREENCNIPASWLETIMRKSATFAKHQSLMISYHQKSKGQGRNTVLSARENEILRDLYNGLSRPEIAIKQGLSANTINSAINNIFNKLGAHTTADAVRIAATEKLV